MNGMLLWHLLTRSNGAFLPSLKSFHHSSTHLITTASFIAPGCASLQELPKEYIENQKSVDSAILKALDADVKGYLGTRFSLKSADRPHLMKF